MGRHWKSKLNKRTGIIEFEYVELLKTQKHTYITLPDVKTEREMKQDNRDMIEMIELIGKITTSQPTNGNDG